MKNEVWEVKPIEHFYSLFFVYKYEDTVGILHEISLVGKYCDPTIFDQMVTVNQVSITDISYDPYVEELQLKGRRRRLEHDNQ